MYGQNFMSMSIKHKIVTSISRRKGLTYLVIYVHAQHIYSFRYNINVTTGFFRISFYCRAYTLSLDTLHDNKVILHLSLTLKRGIACSGCSVRETRSTPIPPSMILSLVSLVNSWSTCRSHHQRGLSHKIH